jgi:hypothetical protein
MTSAIAAGPALSDISGVATAKAVRQATDSNRWWLGATWTDSGSSQAWGGSLMAELQVNDVRLYYEEHGQGPPILCVHGTGGSALMWGAAVPELARLGRVIVYDRRGCTRSQRPDPYDKTSVGEHTEDAAALLEALGAIPAAVIGRSYGGEVATDLALR